jgi:hypothetical protein
MNNEEKKIVSYDPQTGEPIYEETTTQPVEATPTVNAVEQPKKSHAGLIIGISIGAVAFILIASVLALMIIPAIARSKVNNGPAITDEEKTFYGESYEIKYKSPWTEKTGKLTNGEEEKYLSYDNDKIALLPLGSSDLSKTSTADFSTSTGKFKLYNEFREYWGKTDNISNGTGTFYTLVDNVYYASMDYTRGKVSGKLYLIASEENNILLSFSTEVSIDKNTADEEVLKLFKNINLNTIYDDEMAGYLDTMSNWNTYKSARSGDLGKKKTIEGGWRILANSEEYWTFKNGEFYYYKSVNDLNDNYYQGTYKVYTGKTGAAKVGIEESKIDAIVSRNKGIKETDIYTLILTPKKIISGGEDKSSTNLGSEDWHIVWILVDHGKEGIEGQQLNVKTADTSYYVKIKD